MSKSEDEKKYLFSPHKRGEERTEPYFLIGSDDFDEYLRRIDTREASAEEYDEFVLRLIQDFIDSVYSGTPPKVWVMMYLANQFDKVLQGGRWEDEFPLPWTKQSLPLTRPQWRGLSVFCDIENTRRSEPTKKVTEIISDVASCWNMSYERARDYYYEHRSRLSDSDTKNSE